MKSKFEWLSVSPCDTYAFGYRLATNHVVLGDVSVDVLVPVLVGFLDGGLVLDDTCAQVLGFHEWTGRRYLAFGLHGRRT